MRYAADLEAVGYSGARAGDSYAEERDRAWLLFVVQQLVEFANTAEEYVGWLQANRSGLVGEVSEPVYNELLSHARVFVEFSYRGLRAGEVQADVNPVAMVLHEN